MGQRRVAQLGRIVLGISLIAGMVIGLTQLRSAEGQPAEPSPLGIQVVGPREWLTGSAASLRVVVTDHSKGEPVRRATVRIKLSPADGGAETVLYSGRTRAFGTIRASFEVPELEPGSYKLRVVATAGALSDTAEETVTLKRSTQILLNTDKPIYQPSQVIHIRALALRRPGLKAAAGQTLVLEVSDAKGNKVFKKSTETNDFGVVSADFQLADEVNMGRYTLRAILGDDEAEKTVTVQRYVLPKFKVVTTTDRGYYLPGERVEGKVQADYFFGKPVSKGKVAISVKTFDVEFTEVQKIEGETDENGTFEFECQLPTHFVGQPLEQGDAFLQFEVAVTDQADHKETSIHTSSVAAGHLNVNAVAEAGNLVDGVENIVYVMLSRPTGEPAEGTIRIKRVSIGDADITLERTDFRTDELGIAEVPLTVKLPDTPDGTGGPGMGGGMPGMGMGGMGGGFAPPGGMGRMGRMGSPQPESTPAVLEIAARLPDGTVIEKRIEIATRPGGADNLLLRVDRPLAKVGDRINATAYCSADGGAVYFDIIKDRQTLLTRAADVAAGQASINLRLPPDASGTAYLSAYRIMPSGQIVRDTRPLFVQPASDLTIDVAADKDTYVPGGDAQLTFAVADSAGRPVAAALGINIVDESVFALQELQPGMEKVFFYLEQELMKPRYEIHGFELPTIITHKPGDTEAGTGLVRDRAAKVLFASVDVPDMNVFEIDTFTTRLAALKDEWAGKMVEMVGKIQQAVQQYSQAHEQPLPVKGALAALIADELLKEGDVKDLWDRQVRLASGDGPDAKVMQAVVVQSAGPDGKFDTVDDVIMHGYAGTQWFATLDEACQPQVQMLMRGMALGMGGGMGGAPGMVFKGDMAMAGAMPMAMAAAAPDGVMTVPGPTGASGEAQKPVRVREYFPETLLFEPSLITDETGKATLTVPMADSITTWRLAAMANSAIGQLGSTTKGLRCFQDFFVDIDLPVSLTQNDQVSIPIAVYNYLPTSQKVRLEMSEGDWFELKGERAQTLEIAANDVDVRYFTLTVRKIGDHPLTVHASGSTMSDAIKRTIEVVPDGKRVETTAGGRLSGTVEETLTVPAEAIEDASTILVKVYPGIFSQAVEGLDSILRMPSGCFEQTTSSTWPNIMVLDYMKTTKQATPEIRMKAEGFINTGYQRMLSYEVPGGGFSWFGDAPANRLLTSYGIMCFDDMSAVHSVDPAVIQRTQSWLLDQAGADGVYKPDENYLHAETWGGLQSSDLLPTSYVLWGLTQTGCKDARMEQSAAYVRKNWKQATEAYSLSIAANALVGVDTMLHGQDLDDSTLEALRALVKMAKTKGEQMWWEAGVGGITHSTGKSADLEATGMAAIALIRSGLYAGEVSRVLNYLIAEKDPNGTWYSTNATMLALRALVMAQKSAGTSRTNGEVTVMVNGKQAAGFAITPENADVMRLIDCRKFVKPGENDVKVQFAGEGSTLYQVVGRYFMPWKDEKAGGVEPLAIDVKYDKARLTKDDTITANVTVKNNTPGTTSMIIVDLGVPPGFAVDAGDFAELVGSKKISRFNMTGRQVIVYLEKLEPRQTIKFSYVLTAKFPIKAKTPKSTVYEYYNPTNRADSAPIGLEVVDG